MPENLYFVGNFGTPTQKVPGGGDTAAPTTGTAPTVMLQLAAPSTRQICIVEYGISFTGAPAGAALSLRSCNASAASAATTAAVIFPYTNPNAPASLCVTGTALTCYTTNANTTSVLPSASSTVNMVYDSQLLTTNTFIKQFPLGREPVLQVSDFAQILIQVPTTSVTALTYLVWRE